MKYSVLLLAISSIFVAACEDDEDPSHEPKIYFKNDGVYEIAPTDTLLIEPKIIYDKRSTYQWLVDNQVVSNELNYLFAPKAMRDYSLTFSVDNSNGADTFNLRVSVVKNIDFEQFDNFTIPSKSDLYLLPDTLTREFFIIDDVRFNTQINADTTAWNGLAFSNRTSPANSINDAKAGCAYVLNSSASKNYGVVHNVDSLDASKVIFTDRSYSVKSIDVANDNFVYLASKYGYLSADSALTYSYFSYDDYLRLDIYGLNSDGSDGAFVSFNLIDCHFDNPAKFVRVSDWTSVDLRSLGRVYGLRFEVVCSQPDYPQIFCIDNIKLQD